MSYPMVLIKIIYLRFSFFFFFLPFLLIYCRFLLFHLITLNDTHTKRHTYTHTQTHAHTRTTRSHTHTHAHTHTRTHAHTLSRSSLDEGSARRKDLYLTTNITYKKVAFMLSSKFKPAIPASESPQTYALDRATKWIDYYLFI
jgi:hypothetical protein